MLECVTHQWRRVRSAAILLVGQPARGVVPSVKVVACPWNNLLRKELHVLVLGEGPLTRLNDLEGKLLTCDIMWLSTGLCII